MGALKALFFLDLEFRFFPGLEGKLGTQLVCLESSGVQAKAVKKIILSDNCKVVGFVLVLFFTLPKQNQEFNVKRNPLS